MRKEKRASYFYDLSKLVLTTFGVGGIAPYMLGTADQIYWIAVMFGVVASAFFAVVGDRILK